MKISCARVSTNQQDTDLQISALQNDGCDRIYEDVLTGRTKERPDLSRILEALREGDVFVVWKLDRLGRSLKDLIEIIDGFKANGIHFRSLSAYSDVPDH